MKRALLALAAVATAWAWAWDRREWSRLANTITDNALEDIEELREALAVALSDGNGVSHVGPVEVESIEAEGLTLGHVRHDDGTTTWRLA